MHVGQGLEYLDDLLELSRSPDVLSGDSSTPSGDGVVGLGLYGQIKWIVVRLENADFGP